MSVQKINLKETIEWLIEEFKKIESGDDKQYIKTKLFQSLAVRFVTKLHNDGRRSVQHKVTLKTARGYLTKARNAIREITGIHHRFESELSRLMKKYPRSSVFVGELSGLTSTEDAWSVKTKLLGELSCANELKIAVDSLDFSKRTINTKVNKLSERHPVYADYLNNLITGTSVMVAKTELFKAINEAKDLYGELKALKVDHELIVSLKVPSADSAFFKKDKDERLEKRKNNSVFVDYPRYMQQITTILENPDAYFNGIVSGIAPLVFALCAASGRRSIEIFLLGDFVAKGKHNLLFTGQAKKREDDNTERLIYSLVDSDTFIHALAVLRNHTLTKKIIAESEPKDHYSTNEIIKGKISPHLNNFAKDFFVDRKRVSKDVRGIYGRICYQEYYLTDSRWRKKDEDVFASELYGHSDNDSQANYKPYKLNNYVANYKATALENTRWQGLCELDEDMEGLSRGSTAIDIHTWVKNAVEQNPTITINQSVLVRETKKFRGTIKNYLDAIGDLASPGEPLTTQVFEDVVEEEFSEPVEKTTKPKKINSAKKPLPFDGDKGFKPEKVTTVKHKPKLSAKSLGDGLWEVIVKLDNKTQLFSLNTGEKIEAMKLAYSLFTGEVFEFKVTIPYKKGPHFQDNVYAATEKTAEIIAINDAGLDGFKGPYNKIQVRKL